MSKDSWAEMALASYGARMDEVRVWEVLMRAAGEVREALGGVTDWSIRAGGHDSQLEVDVIADRAALRVLDAAGFGVLSEESGLHAPERSVLVVLDPLDGSSNAARRLPWYATSLCALDVDGPLVGVVVNQETGEVFDAIRGRGARCDGTRIDSSACEQLGDATVGFSGWPPRHGGWGELRVLDAAALDLCAVAAGHLDGWVDCDVDAHGPWDYMAAVLICAEAGADLVDGFGRDLVTREPRTRRTPVAGATPGLCRELVHYRRSLTTPASSGDAG